MVDQPEKYKRVTVSRRDGEKSLVQQFDFQGTFVCTGELIEDVIFSWYICLHIYWHNNQIHLQHRRSERPEPESVEGWASIGWTKGRNPREANRGWANPSSRSWAALSEMYRFSQGCNFKFPGGGRYRSNLLPALPVSLICLEGVLKLWDNFDLLFSNIAQRIQQIW